MVMMGLLFDFDRFGVWVEKLKINFYVFIYVMLFNMFILLGVVVVRIKGEIVVVIGVGGVFGGEKDEVCVVIGLVKI